MTRRILSLFWIVAFVIVTVGVSSASAQTTITSDGVSVRNSEPADVFFMFPLGPDSNVTEIQLVCSAGTAPGAAFVYEEQPNGQIVTYDNPGTRVDCNETYGGHSPNFTFTGSLKNDITVTTPDHTITITTSTAWTAANVSCGRSGYCWKATGGSSQIVVQ